MAVLGAVREARRRAVEGKKGVLVEAMTYRVGHHSTSDDSSKYRAAEEVKEWSIVGEQMVLLLTLLTTDNPIHRLRAFLVEKKWWSEPEDTALLSKHKSDVLASFRRAEKLPKPKLGEMFNDIWPVKRGEEVPRVIVSVFCSYIAHSRWSKEQSLGGC